MLSGGSLGTKALPELKKNSVNLNRVLAAQGSAGSDGGSNQRLMKASPEALALMMANMKKNDASSANSS